MPDAIWVDVGNADELKHQPAVASQTWTRECIVRLFPYFHVLALFCVAGFRPGRRGPFVSAKGPKTSDAPSGLMRTDGRQSAEGGPTRSAHTRPPEARPSLGPAGRRRTR